MLTSTPTRRGAQHAPRETTCRSAAYERIALDEDPPTTASATRDGAVARPAKLRSPHAYLDARAHLGALPKPLLWVDAACLEDGATGERSTAVIGVVTEPRRSGGGGGGSAGGAADSGGEGGGGGGVEATVRLECGGASAAGRCLRDWWTLWLPALRLACVLCCCLRCVRMLAACACQHLVCCCSRGCGRRRPAHQESSTRQRDQSHEPLFAVIAEPTASAEVEEVLPV